VHALGHWKHDTIPTRFARLDASVAKKRGSSKWRVAMEEEVKCYLVTDILCLSSRPYWSNVSLLASLLAQRVSPRVLIGPTCLSSRPYWPNVFILASLLAQRGLPKDGPGCIRTMDHTPLGGQNQSKITSWQARKPLSENLGNSTALLWNGDLVTRSLLVRKPLRKLPWNWKLHWNPPGNLGTRPRFRTKVKKPFRKRPHSIRRCSHRHRPPPGALAPQAPWRRRRRSHPSPPRPWWAPAPFGVWGLGFRA